MPKVHLDTDLGGDIDDVCALAMLLRWPGAEVTGITTVAEEDGRRAGYARYVLALAQREDIPVAAGASVASGHYRFKPGYPDEAAYWPERISPSPNDPAAALQLLRGSVEQGATLVGIGPYTNFHRLDRAYPGILLDTDIYLMGGYIDPPRPGYPQWGNDMDYNVQLDIDSAQYVFERGNPVLVPLPVALETSLRRAHLDGVRAAGPVGGLIARQAEAFARDWNNERAHGQSCARLPVDVINFQYDPLACAIALGWRDDVTIDEIPLACEVAGGWLHERRAPGGKPTRVVTRVDGNRFNQLWFDVVAAA